MVRTDDEVDERIGVKCISKPNSLSDVRDLLEGIEDPNEIDPNDIDLILTLRNRKQRPLADPLTDIGVNPLIPLKSRTSILGHSPESSIEERIVMNDDEEEGRKMYRRMSYANLNDFDPSEDAEGRNGKQTWFNRVLDGSLQLRRQSFNDASAKSKEPLRVGPLLKCRPTGNFQQKQSFCRQYEPGQRKADFTPKTQGAKMNVSSGKTAEGRFYKAKLQNKMKELQDEINRLEGSYRKSIGEQEACQVYEVRVKELAEEVTGMQNTLTELNILADNVIFYKGEKTDSEIDELVTINNKTLKKIEKLFLQRLEKEKHVNKIQSSVEHLTKKNATLLSAKETKIEHMRSKLIQSNKEIEEWEQKINLLKRKKNLLRDKINNSATKRLLGMENELLKLKKRCGVFETLETQRNDTSNRNELSALENAANEINKQLKDAEKLYFDKMAKENSGYKLTEKEHEESVTINNFLADFEKSRKEITGKLKHLDRGILMTLKELSEQIPLVSMTNSPFDVNTKTANAESLADSVVSLKRTLTRLKDKENKLVEDSEAVGTRIDRMREDLKEFFSFNEIDKKFKSKQKELLDNRAKVEESSDMVADNLKGVKRRFAKLSQDLNNNTNHKQISRLEKRLSQVTEEVRHFNEIIENIFFVNDVKQLQKEALIVLININKLLTDV